MRRSVAPPPGPRCYGCWGLIEPLEDLSIIVCPTCFQISACVVALAREVEPLAVVAARAAALGAPLPQVNVQKALCSRQDLILAQARRWRERRAG